MTHLTKEIDEVTHYAYAEAIVQSKTITKIFWDKDDSLDRTVSAFKGAPNERQYLKLADNAFEDVRFLDVHEAIVGQDALGNDIKEYSITNDIDVRNDILMSEIRQKRDMLLKECDWTQIPDSPLAANIKQDWANYRQALRDFPANVVDLDNPVWPEKP